jgi:hypothetical protein
MLRDGAQREVLWVMALAMTFGVFEVAALAAEELLSRTVLTPHQAAKEMPRVLHTPPLRVGFALTLGVNFKLTACGTRRAPSFNLCL